MPKDFLLANGLGLLLGIALVWWAAPRTSSGVVFLVVVCVLVCNVVGALASAIGRWFGKSGAQPKGAERHD